MPVEAGRWPERISNELGFERLDEDGPGEPFGGPLN